MNSIEKLLLRMRRLWVLEHCGRRALLISAAAVNACLLCLLLNRLVGLPLWSVAVVVVAAVIATIAVAATAMRKVPSKAKLAQLMDTRAGTRDLFASALEFSGCQPTQADTGTSAKGNSQFAIRNSQSFGWLGDLTCQLAVKRASEVMLRLNWSLGARRNLAATASLAGTFAVLLIAYLAVAGSGASPVASGGAVTAAPPPPPPPVLIAKSPEPPPRPADPAPTTTIAPAEEEIIDSAEKPAEDAVKITNEMINQYLAQMPQDEVDLEGVTPIRWDMDEASGKNNPQNQDRTNDKIDPVKLDAAMMKDLETAKKTKQEGESKGGVDVAVMGADNEGSAAKGKEGGKNPNASLADAISKDPRGNPTRLAVKLTKQGLQVRSAFANATRQRGEDRPMGLLDFLVAVKKAQSDSASLGDVPSAQVSSKAGENIVRLESQLDDSPKAAGVADSYFSHLRKADK